MFSWYSCQNIPSGGRKKDSKSTMLVCFRWTVEMFISVAPVYEQSFGACMRFSIKTIVITIIYYIYALHIYTIIHFMVIIVIITMIRAMNCMFSWKPWKAISPELLTSHGNPVNHFVTILSGSGWYAHLSPQGWLAQTATNCYLLSICFPVAISSCHGHCWGW